MNGITGHYYEGIRVIIGQRVKTGILEIRENGAITREMNVKGKREAKTICKQYGILPYNF
jgi:hypothetical protein